MRHNARFVYKKNQDDFLEWFENELNLMDDSFEVVVHEHKYDIEIIVGRGENEISYSVFSNPKKQFNLCLHVKPRLSFFSALLGKNDTLREKATEIAHSILNRSPDITELGWYLEQQAWKSPTMTP